MSEISFQDSLGAFVPGPHLRLEPKGPGPFGGMTFAAKDIFDVAGQVTGCGNPDWARSHEPAAATAPVIAALLRAGAELVGKTVTDELAYSLNGQNAHYGTPTNSNAPGRIAGGSSCGSAAAVAGGLCDVALGSDTGGSVRVPASYCGLFGLRPTHGRIPLEGIMPLAPSFDTIGWFARDAVTLARVGGVLLKADPAAMPPFERLLLAEDAFALAVPKVAEVLRPFVVRLEQRLAKAEPVIAGEPGGGLIEWMWRFRTIQAAEIRAQHGAWIEAVRPSFGPEVAERFAWALSVTDEQAAPARAAREDFAARLRGLLAPGTLMVLPSAPDIAPLLGADLEALAEHRSRVLALTSIAGLAGLPQVSLPLAQIDGCPVGLSLIAPHGADRALLNFVRAFAGSLGME